VSDLVVRPARQADVALSRDRDWSFDITHVVEPCFDRPMVEGLRAVTPYAKDYGDDFADHVAAFDAADQACFVALREEVLAGYVVARVHWNGLALVESIAVDRNARKGGVASALMDAVRDWAKAKGLAGITLETQDTNAGACLFYERYGFRLEGIDRALYRAIPKSAGETALFWYLSLKA
jgi:ribosomal protein S18 acetylase RimI-like enzyme